MRQIKTFSDDRLNHFCAYCGDTADTRDHSPSKIFLQEPFPANLPVVPACFNCNNGFSLDEEYLGCLLECVLSGATNPDMFSRVNIANILKDKASLKARLEKSKQIIDGSTHFQIEEDRVKNVVVKLAQGHCRFENSESMIEPPILVWFQSLETMTDIEVEDFFSIEEQQILPEVGSRATFELVVSSTGIPLSKWVIVQSENYRYSIVCLHNKRIVKIVIWGYLACKVIWS